MLKTKDSAFNNFMNQVDAKVYEVYGMHVGEFPDLYYRDMFDEGKSIEYVLAEIAHMLLIDCGI